MNFRYNYLLCLLSMLLLAGCGSDSDPAPTCDETLALTIVSISKPSACNLSDGSLEVVGNGGEAPLAYSIDNGSTFQESPVFEDLAAGSYTILALDANDCSFQDVAAIIEPATSDLAVAAITTDDTQCFENNGQIAVSATGGESPYEFSIGAGFVSNNIFNSLAPGSYSVVARDATGCTTTINAEVPKGDTGTSYAADIDAIVMASCAIPNCHNGDTGSDLDWTDFEKFQASAEETKARTQSGDMPRNGSLTDEEKALIACWVDEGAKDN